MSIYNPLQKYTHILYIAHWCELSVSMVLEKRPPGLSDSWWTGYDIQPHSHRDCKKHSATLCAAWLCFASTLSFCCTVLFSPAATSSSLFPRLPFAQPPFCLLTGSLYRHEESDKDKHSFFPFETLHLMIDNCCIISLTDVQI